NHFTGDGKVLIQTRNLHSLAEALQPLNSNS
ncbi:TIGR00266 family protein, partial [Lactobacillus delbrueckii subsp. bulgaricus]